MIIYKQAVNAVLLTVLINSSISLAQEHESVSSPGTTAISKDVEGLAPVVADTKKSQTSTVPGTTDLAQNEEIAMPIVVTGPTVLSSGYADRKTVSIPRVSTAPVLDGVLDDAVWEEATVIKDMHQFLPVDHGEPTERSEFYLMYDDDYLYIGAKLYDSEPEQIYARQLIQGQTLQFDDAFEFILDPFNNMRSGYYFQLNPNAVRRDGIYENVSELNRNWDGIWEAEARIDAEGWTAEVAIPFKTLNFDPANPDWGFTIARTIARKKEELAWASYDRKLNPGTAGVLTGFKGLQQGKGLDIVPSITIGGNKDFIASDTDFLFEPSLDVSYNITPSLKGALTINTDFSATEIDDRQVNLSRFSLFFPEKRDFFLQDADIFSFGRLNQNGNPFFSRKIGLSDTGEPVDLNVGVKLTGRIGRWNIGALTVRQAAFDDVDASMLMVGRVSANVLEESSIGAIMTYGDPLSNNDNSVVGADFQYRNTHFMSSRSLQGNLWYQQSNTPGLAGDEQAWGARLNIGASEGLGGNLIYQRFGEDFNPALGFANRTGISRIQLNTGYRIRPDDHPLLRSYMAFMRFERIENLDGELESQDIFMRPIGLENHIGDEIGFLMFRGREVLFEDFEISPGVVIPVGDYTFYRLGIELELATERVFAPNFRVFFGEYFNGDRLNVRGGFAWRPNRHFFVGIDYDYNKIELPAGSFQTRLITINANWAINAKWSWVNLVQYDNFSNSVGFNSRLRWSPRAGEDLYVVLNHNFDAEGTFRGLSSNESEILLKYKKTFRF